MSCVRLLRLSVIRCNIIYLYFIFYSYFIRDVNRNINDFCKFSLNDFDDDFCKFSFLT